MKKEILKKYGVIISVLVPVIILVIIRASGKDHFQPDAKKLSEKPVDRSNIIVQDRLQSLGDNILIISLGKNTNPNIPENMRVISIQPDSILSAGNTSLIRNHKGSIVLASEDISISSRIWMLLSQMGYEKLYILSNDPEPEALKYEFRPDTITRPEF